MPDQVTSAGLEIEILANIITQLETDLKAIYGDDIIITQNSPDGQKINIIAQAGIDIRELIQAVYNSMDPDQAEGVLLDARCAINNITRRGGTYTIVPINITVDRTLDLIGLDTEYDNPEPPAGTYTVQDNAGNEFVLLNSDTLIAGVHLLNFRSKIIGAITAVAGTIQTAKTIVLGVTAIDNPGAASIVGEDQETDVELKIRRSKSRANDSSGYLNGLEGALNALDAVTEARVYENFTKVDPDTRGIPANCIWAIVEGGVDLSIATLILAKKTNGCNMKGDESASITTPAGGTVTAYFDRPEPKDLYIRFDFKQIDPEATPDLAAVKQYIEDNLKFLIGQYADTSAVGIQAVAGINASGGGGVPLNIEISNNGSAWDDYLDVDTLDEKWAVDVTRITITEI
jgi:uncharacterized phage protein gp47/JayE